MFEFKVKSSKEKFLSHNADGISALSLLRTSGLKVVIKKGAGTRISRECSEKIYSTGTPT